MATVGFNGAFMFASQANGRVVLFAKAPGKGRKVDLSKTTISAIKLKREISTTIASGELLCGFTQGCFNEKE
jgi:hypothetical protein